MQVLLTALQETQVLVMAAGLVLLLAWETLHPFFDLFHHSWKDRSRHVVRNLAVGAVNSLLVAVVFVTLWLITALWAEEHGFGLLYWLEGVVDVPTWVHVTLGILMIDAWTYIWHRMNHRIPFFWRFHRVHHADNKMDVTTASRFHVGEIFLSSLLRIPIIALTGIYVWELVLYETLMFAVVQFHHANIILPDRVDRLLRLVIVSPGMHKVHHSRWRPETDSNYSSLFSFWDRIGQSYRERDDLSKIKLGLEGFDDDEFHEIKGIFKTPLAPLHREGDREPKSKSQTTSHPR